MEIVLSEYPDKSHNFRNFIFMTSHFSTLYALKIEQKNLNLNLNRINKPDRRLTKHALKGKDFLADPGIFL